MVTFYFKSECKKFNELLYYILTINMKSSKKTVSPLKKDKISLWLRLIYSIKQSIFVPETDLS